MVISAVEKQKLGKVDRKFGGRAPISVGWSGKAAVRRWHLGKVCVMRGSEPGRNLEAKGVQAEEGGASMPGVAEEGNVAGLDSEETT